MTNTFTILWDLMLGHRVKGKEYFPYYLKTIGITKLTTIFLIVASFSLFILPAEQAFALTTINWSAASFQPLYGPAWGGPPLPITFTVENDDLAGNAGIDTISVLITSSVGDSTTLSLEENALNNGIFTNTKLIFMYENAEFGITDTGTLLIYDDCSSSEVGNCDPNMIETLIGGTGSGMTVYSTTEPGGIFFDLTETGPNTSEFTTTLHFSTISSDPLSSTLLVSPGDTITIEDELNGSWVNGLIIPPLIGAGAIQVEEFGTVTASYNGVSETVNVDPTGLPGRGGGGAVRPGLVLNFLAAASGSITFVDPTLGVLRNGILVQTNGFCFDLFCLDVFEYFNHLPIQQVNSGSTHTISLTAYCPGGSNRCNFASVGAAPPGTDINSVDWNVMLKRTGNSNDWQVTKNDPNGMLGDVTGTVQVIDASRIQFTFNVQFITPASIGTVDGNAEPPEDNMILVTEIRNSKGGSGRNIFNEGVFVNDIYAYPQVDASYLPSVTVAPLCLNEDPTDRNTCAFELVRQWTIKQAEEKLKEIYEQNNYKTD